MKLKIVQLKKSSTSVLPRVSSGPKPDGFLSSSCSLKVVSLLGNAPRYSDYQSDILLLNYREKKINKNMNKNAICILSYKLELVELSFLNLLQKYNVYIVVDDNFVDCNLHKQKFKNITFLQFDNALVEKNNFIFSTTLTSGKNVTSWDKGLYYFKNTNYLNVWFIEEDVFFSSEETLFNIDEKYSDSDILCHCDFTDRIGGRLNEWLWGRIYLKNLIPPFYSGMVCASRLSKTLLKEIGNYAAQEKTLFFIEALLPTIAKKHGLKIEVLPEELKTVTYCNQFKEEEINKTNLFHPMKSLEKQKYYRNLLNSI
jgi:hypothetical protein